MTKTEELPQPRGAPGDRTAKCTVGGLGLDPGPTKGRWDSWRIENEIC